MLVGIESEKRYDKLVKEVLTKKEANNLYIKLEKCNVKNERSRLSIFLFFFLIFILFSIYFPLFHF